MSLELDLVRAALPNYEVGSEVGRGGWGVVLSGVHRTLGRRVAIKQLPRAFANDPVARQRFIDEARIVSSMDHPHIVPVYDFVEHSGVQLIVMELLDGGTLWDRFTSSGVRADHACVVTVAMCAALDAAHTVGVLHRDIKPENVLFNARGVPKLSDFGTAKVLGTSTRLTMVGEVVGTPAYMSPEQVLGRALEPPSDLYSLGVVLYELLCGRLPFPDEDPLVLLNKHATAEPDPVGDVADVPAAVAAVVMQALGKDPDGRFHSAEELGVRLAEAAGDAYGPGWLSETGIPLLGGGPIVRAAHQSVRDGFTRARPTVHRSTLPGHHRRVGAVVSDGAVHGMALDPGSSAAGGAAATLPPRRVAGDGAPPEIPPGPAEEVGEPPARGRSRRVRVLAGVLAVALLALLVVVLVLVRGGGDDGSDVEALAAASDGRTVYVTTNDASGTSSCYDPCSNTWPPVTPPEEFAGIDARRIGEISRTDGLRQVTLDGRPLYRFVHDERPGDTNGHLVSGVWFAVGKNGQPVAPPTVHVGSTDAGSVLIDPDGFTLYISADDPAGESACTGDCAETWRPVPADAPLDSSLEPAQFGETVRDDRVSQLTWDDHPLYRFSGDENPGDTNGVAAGGGTWQPVPADDVTRATPSSATTGPASPAESTQPATTQGAHVSVPQAPTPAPDDEIVYTSVRGDNWDLFARNVTTGVERAITTSPERDRLPAWSPDRRSVAFTHAETPSSARAVAASGGQQIVVYQGLDSDARVSWSPDGQRLAFISAEDGSPDVYLLDLASGALDRLTADPIEDGDPAWSPDGTELALWRAEGAATDIWILEVDATLDLRRSDDSGIVARRLVATGDLNADPAWDPTGTKLVFASTRTGNWDLFSVDVAGGQPTQLTTDAADDQTPSWSPDGARIAFESKRDAGDAEVYVMNADGSDQRRLTDHPGFDGHAAWGAPPAP